MSVEMPLNEDHEVLGSEFCSGYSDALGRWNPGFYCPPREDASDALFCCGGATYKYCCTQREHATAEDIGNLPLVLGVALGATAAIGIIILVCACFCQCCQPKAKDSQQAKQAKQQAKQSADGPVYRMQTSSTASGVANMYSFSNQNSLATTPIDTAASQIMVELEPGAVGRTGTMGRGNTFCASGARTLQRNGGHDPPPPYDAGKSAHHTLPHQRHHHQHQQHPHQQQQHPAPPQQHLYPPDSPPQVRQHFTLPRSHGMQSARSPNTTFPQGPPHAGHGLGHGLGHGHAAHPTATLSRVPRAVPASVPVVPVVPVPVVKPPPGPLPLPPGVGPAGLQPPGLQQPGPTSPGPRSPVDSPHRGFQTHTLRHPPSNAVPLHAGGYGMTGMTHSTSSTFQPCPPPQQQQQQQQPPPQQHPQLLQQHQHLPPQPQMQQQQQQGGAGLPPPPNMPAPIPVGPPMGPPMAAPMGPPMGPPMGNPMGPMVVGAPPKGMGAATPLGPGPAMGPMGPAMGPAATNGVPGLVNGANGPNGPNGPNGTELSPGDTLYRSTKF